MKAKSKAQKDMTKAELIIVIKGKTSRIPSRFQSAVKRSFLTGLKYKTKTQLRRIATNMRVEVSRTGYNIYLTRPSKNH